MLTNFTTIAANVSDKTSSDESVSSITQSTKLPSARLVSTCVEQTKYHPSKSSIPPAVIEYRDFPDRPIKLIAAKHGLAPATLIHRARKAGVGMVSLSLPNGIRNFGIDGVWVCDCCCMVALATALHQGLVSASM